MRANSARSGERRCGEPRAGGVLEPRLWLPMRGPDLRGFSSPGEGVPVEGLGLCRTDEGQGEMSKDLGRGPEFRRPRRDRRSSGRAAAAAAAGGSDMAAMCTGASSSQVLGCWAASCSCAGVSSQVDGWVLVGVGVTVATGTGSAVAAATMSGIIQDFTLAAMSTDSLLTSVPICTWCSCFCASPSNDRHLQRPPARVAASPSLTDPASTSVGVPEPDRFECLGKEIARRYYSGQAGQYRAGNKSALSNVGGGHLMVLLTC